MADNALYTFFDNGTGSASAHAYGLRYRMNAPVEGQSLPASKLDDAPAFGDRPEAQAKPNGVKDEHQFQKAISAWRGQ